jgi:hypothetical protein
MPDLSSAIGLSRFYLCAPDSRKSSLKNHIHQWQGSSKNVTRILFKTVKDSGKPRLQILSILKDWTRLLKFTDNHVILQMVKDEKCLNTRKENHKRSMVTLCHVKMKRRTDEASTLCKSHTYAQRTRQ